MKTLIWLCACLCALAMPAQAEGFLRTEGTRIVDAKGQPVILRGMGLGGWMLQEGYMLELPQFGTQSRIRAEIEALIGPDKTQAFYTAWLDTHTTRADIDAMKRWGFNSVRLPMHFALFTLPVDKEPVPGQDTWLEDGFRRTDALLDWAKANDLYVILDLHAAPGGQGNDINISDRDPTKPSLWQDPAHQAKMVSLWRKLADRYKDEPYIAGYDILNEPNWGFADASDRNGCQEKGNAPLRELMVRTTKAIREVDQRHIIIIEGNCWGNNYAGVLDGGLWDPNMVLSFHKYWNFTTRDTLTTILTLRDRYQVPVWLGESGENANTWFSETIRLVESEGIGWAWWPLKKIGYNNPLQIKPNAGYLKLLDYWAGKGSKPSAAEAEAALMQLATQDVAYAHNLQRPDVVDALFRAAHSDESVPFRSHYLLAKGGSLPAADFDMGRNGIAYWDTTAANLYVSTGGKGVTWNPLQAYRNDGVQLGQDKTGLYVTQMVAGEWLKYSFVAQQSGRYTLSLDAEGGVFDISVNGGPAVKAPVTVPLKAGSNSVVVRIVKPGSRLRRLVFTKR
ncbi:cellulase family glycosylhydrolase [Asticcacaulis sp. DW145]|uniref:cellulase family glycosylhydrolase n=1 Tax=Asticcacaulis sp. DW145 TaxID=3095608 RepID=UPI0030854361|nr:cellulase family glycosylhydrolase [Asticcacaulis sp. DW145]